MSGLFNKKDTYTVISQRRVNGIITIETASKQIIRYPRSPLIIQQNNGSFIIDTFLEGIEIELSFQDQASLDKFIKLCKYEI